MSLLSVIVGSKLAVGLIALGTVTVGGAAAAAYTGSLPPALQDGAHALIGAPAADATATPTADPTTSPTGMPAATPTGSATADPTGTADPSARPGPVGPDAAGPAAFGQCNAYLHGGLGPKSVARANLAKAAGGSDAIAAYCATVARPGHTPEPTTAPAAGGTDTEAPETEAPEAPETDGTTGPGDSAAGADTNASKHSSHSSASSHASGSSGHGRP